MVAQMVAVNRALCLFYRNPPAGTKPLSYAKIALKVKNKDGNNPTTGAYAILSWRPTLLTRRRLEGQQA